ncbi:MAG: GNAT family N-acetyltransferase, partial [Acidimicrobiales bacterium]
TGFAEIFPPEAPAPTVEGLTEQWEALIRQGDGDPRSRAFGAWARPARPSWRPRDLGSVPSAAPPSDGAPSEIVVGTAVGQADPTEPRRGHLRSLYVVPEWSGRGVGRRLHDAVVAHLRGAGFAEASLWVMEKNPARAMYEHLGWRMSADRQTIWPGIDEVRYLVDLGSQRSPRSSRYDP